MNRTTSRPLVVAIDASSADPLTAAPYPPGQGGNDTGIVRRRSTGRRAHDDGEGLYSRQSAPRERSQQLLSRHVRASRDLSLLRQLVQLISREGLYSLGVSEARSATSNAVSGSFHCSASLDGASPGSVPSYSSIRRSDASIFSSLSLDS